MSVASISPQKPKSNMAFWCTLLAVAIPILFPIYWMVVTSLQTTDHVLSAPPRFVPDFEVTNYVNIVVHSPLLLWFRNSLLVSFAATACALAVGTPAAFALSRFHYRGRTLFSLGVITTQMMPPIVLIIPLFEIFVRLGIRDTLLGLILGNFAFSLPVVIWMMKAMFDGVPSEVEQAARIDGASWLQILTLVTGPLVLPGLAATAVFSFIEAWDEYMLAHTIISDPGNWVASMGIASFVGEYLTPLNLVMAAAVLFSAPPILLFLVIQRHFVAGLSAGAVKG
jgi:multiple sugar transport system permease protein